MPHKDPEFDDLELDKIPLDLWFQRTLSMEAADFRARLSDDGLPDAEIEQIQCDRDGSNEETEQGLVAPWDRHLHGPVNFISHQWLSRSNPDPDGVHLRVTQDTFKSIIEGREAFSSEEEWKRYSSRFDYAADTVKSPKSSGGWFVNKKQVVAKEAFIKSVREGCVWLDFFSIPNQDARHDDEDSSCHMLSGNTESAGFDLEDQAKAIRSIPAYVTNTTNFWVVAPVCTHKETQAVCGYSTWRARGWCRLEDWMNELSLQAERPLIIDESLKIQVQEFSEKMTHFATNRYAVLSGYFACCSTNHVLNGDPIPCDKLKIASVIRQQYQRKLRHLLKSGDLVQYAWFQCLRPSILKGDTVSAYPADEDTSAFLKRYGWLDDIEGSDQAAQPVFFPLMCASTEGNISAVRSFLAAGADPKRRMLGVAVSSLEAAALCGQLDVCIELVEAGAEVNGSSQLDGCTPLIKAARGGSAEVIEYLIAQGADIEATDHEGRSAMQIAEAEGISDCVSLLSTAKFDIIATQVSTS